MFDFLPASEEFILENSPLVQVIAQIRFNSQSGFATHQVASQFHDRLADRYPRLLAEQQTQITANPGGVTSVNTPQWRMTDLDGKWSVVVAPEVLTIETNDYRDWGLLRDRLEEAVLALVEFGTVRVRERSGLRYVNHIAPAATADVDHCLRPEILGPAAMPGWAAALEVSVAQTILRDGEARMGIRYGRGNDVVPNGAFLLDIDCFSDVAKEFDRDAVLSEFDQLNSAALRCFVALLDESYLRGLRN